MKKLILNTVVLVFSISSFAQTAQKILQSNATFGKRIDCSPGRGVCAFSTSTDLSKTSVSESAVRITERSFMMTIFRSTLSPSEEIGLAGKFFASIPQGEKPSFVQEETVIVDEASLINLNMNKVYNKIIPGSYLMEIKRDRVEVTFSLTN